MLYAYNGTYLALKSNEILTQVSPTFQKFTLHYLGVLGKLSEAEMV